MELLVNPHLYSLRHSHLNLDATFARSQMIYDHAAIEVWLWSIAQAIKPPYLFKFEVGQGSLPGMLGELHVHLIAEGNAGLLHNRRPEVIKPVRAGTEETLFRYVYKLPVPPIGKALIEYQKGLVEAAKAGLSLPKVSGYVWKQEAFEAV